MLEEQAMITFLKKFDEHPFLVKINGHEHLIGEGAPTFTVNFKKVIPLKDLVTSTSLALGEAYMDGDLDIEGNLYQALDNFHVPIFIKEKPEKRSQQSLRYRK